MTLEELIDRESIRQTLANYNMAGDRLKVDDFVAVFTQEGILETESVPEHDGFCYRGRDEIRAWLTRWQRGDSTSTTPTHQASFVRHHLSTCDIKLLSVTEARSRTYWTAYTDIGADHGGYYLDALQKVDGEWLIAHRRIRLDWRADNSLMFDAIKNSRGE